MPDNTKSVAESLREDNELEWSDWRATCGSQEEITRCACEDYLCHQDRAELLQALKAEREHAEELEAENDAFTVAMKRDVGRIKELEAKLKARHDNSELYSTIRELQSENKRLKKADKHREKLWKSRIEELEAELEKLQVYLYVRTEGKCRDLAAEQEAQKRIEALEAEFEQERKDFREAWALKEKAESRIKELEAENKELHEILIGSTGSPPKVCKLAQTHK